jgi:hypothetical protein
MARHALLRILGPILVGVTCGACASYSNVRFAPAIQDTDLRGEADDVQAHITVAWRGIEEREGVPELRFRIRVDNPGPTPFTLVPAEFELLDAALTSFGTVDSDDLPVVVEAHHSATFDIAFPARESLERFDLGVLTLRTRFQGHRWSWSTTFQRVEPPPPAGPSWGFGVGVGFEL